MVPQQFALQLVQRNLGDRFSGREGQVRGGAGRLPEGHPAGFHAQGGKADVGTGDGHGEKEILPSAVHHDAVGHGIGPVPEAEKALEVRLSRFALATGVGIKGIMGGRHAVGMDWGPAVNVVPG
jgi:hypothetical protein